jgi:hypothetical protein
MFDRLSKVLRTFQQRQRHEHGWQVELRCGRCGTTAVPQYLGWTPNARIAFGSRPTIYADLVCPQCAASLTSTAGEKLVELFGPMTMPPENKGAMIAFVLLTVGFVAAGLVIQAWRAWAWLAIIPLLAVRPLMLWFSNRVSSLRRECPCGDPRYLFMGMLGRSMCYRCSACGHLLRLRN